MKKNEIENKEKFDNFVKRNTLLEDLVKKFEEDLKYKENTMKELITEIDNYKSNFNLFEENFLKIKSEISEEEKLNDFLKKENNVDKTLKLGND